MCVCSCIFKKLRAFILHPHEYFEEKTYIGMEPFSWDKRFHIRYLQVIETNPHCICWKVKNLWVKKMLVYWHANEKNNAGPSFLCH